MYLRAVFAQAHSFSFIAGLEIRQIALSLRVQSRLFARLEDAKRLANHFLGAILVEFFGPRIPTTNGAALVGGGANDGVVGGIDRGVREGEVGGSTGRRGDSGPRWLGTT